MTLKTNLDTIHSSLQEIESDIDAQLDKLEGEAPDHMKFERIREAQVDLKEQVHQLQKWIDNFSIGRIDVRNY